MPGAETGAFPLPLTEADGLAAGAAPGSCGVGAGDGAGIGPLGPGAGGTTMLADAGRCGRLNSGSQAQAVMDGIGGCVGGGRASVA